MRGCRKLPSEWDDPSWQSWGMEYPPSHIIESIEFIESIESIEFIVSIYSVGSSSLCNPLITELGHDSHLGTHHLPNCVILFPTDKLPGQDGTCPRWWKPFSNLRLWLFPRDFAIGLNIDSTKIMQIQGLVAHVEFYQVLGGHQKSGPAGVSAVLWVRSM